MPASSRCESLAGDAHELVAERVELRERAPVGEVLEEQAIDRAGGKAGNKGAEAAEAFCTMSMDEFALVHGEKLDDESSVPRLIELADRCGMPAVRILCLSHCGQRAEWQGDYRRAISFTERAVNFRSISNSSIFA